MSAGGLALYEASLLPAFRAYVLPELSPGARSPLVPYVLGTFAEHSSLGHMIDVVVRDCFDAPPRDLDALGPAACIFATDLALDAWLSAAEARGFTIALPPGSRLMHTGGPKGMKRSIPTGELYARALRALGIPASHCVNEYGMTELRSQFYDSVLRDGRDEPLPRRKHGPPWVRVSAHDPQTLDAVPAGTPGLLRVFDLANFGSALAIQTEDKAVVDDDGAFRLLGRAAGAEPRGCSLDAEVLPA